MANENLSGAPEENNGELSQASKTYATTWDEIINGKTAPKPAGSFGGSEAPSKTAPIFEEEDPEVENYYDDVPVNEEPFYFDPDEEDISQNFMKDPTDFTDVAGNAKKNRILKVVGGSLLVVAVIVGGGYFGLKTFVESQDSNQRAADAATSQKTDTASPNVPSKPKAPLLDLTSNAPAAIPGKITATVVGSTVVTSDNISLTVRNSKLSEIQSICTTTLTTDFCLAARGADSVDPTKTRDIYFFKDAAHSRIFEEPANFKKVNVSGSLAAASMDINLVAGKSTPVIVVVAPNSSGYMIALPQGTSSEDASTFAETLSLS